MTRFLAERFCKLPFKVFLTLKKKKKSTPQNDGIHNFIAQLSTIVSKCVSCAFGGNRQYATAALHRHYIENDFSNNKSDLVPSFLKLPGILHPLMPYEYLLFVPASSLIVMYDYINRNICLWQIYNMPADLIRMHAYFPPVR